MAKRTALITGANTGLGKEVARQLARSGRYAKIVLACRDPGKAAAAREDLARTTGRAVFETWTVDLSHVAGVRAAAATLTLEVDDLVMNAGGTGGKAPLALTADGVTEIFAANVLGHVVLFDALVHARQLRRAAVYVGSEAARGVPQLGMPRPEFPTHSVDELVAAAEGRVGDGGVRGRIPEPRLAYGQAKYIAALWMAAEARRNPSLRLLTMSPGNTSGTDLFRDFPLVPRLLFNHVLMPVVLPLLGRAHDRAHGAVRLVQALDDESLGSGLFYASRPGKVTGAVVDQSAVRPALANAAFHDHAAEAMHRLVTRVR